MKSAKDYHMTQTELLMACVPTIFQELSCSEYNPKFVTIALRLTNTIINSILQT